MNEMYLDRLITEAIRDLVAGEYRRSAENMADLASTWAKAGLPLSSFQHMRGYIIQEAQLVNPACRVFLEAEEKTLQQARVSANGIIVH